MNLTANTPPINTSLEKFQPKWNQNYRKSQKTFFSALRFGMLYKPIDNWIDVGRILAWDHEAAYFSVSNWFEPPAKRMVSSFIKTQTDTETAYTTEVKECMSTYISSVKACLDRAPGLSILFPRTSRGIPLSEGLLSRSWSSLFDMPMLSGSAASTT